MRSGLLFTKEGLRGTFARRQYILIGGLGGRLIEYESHPRNIRNQLLPTAYHQRIKTIYLGGAYVFCGQLSLAFFRRENDTAKERGVIHRIYEDSLESSDELVDCIFTIWRKGKSARIFRARSMVRSFPDSYIVQYTEPFLLSHQIERNEWLFALKAAIDWAE